MRVNHSVPPPTLVPVLVYPDVRAAVAFLTSAFGFVERTRIGESHRAQLAVGDDGAVIVADASNERRPPQPGGVTHVVRVRVTDVDAAFARARDQGAVVLEAPVHREYGERDCTLRGPRRPPLAAGRSGSGRGTGGVRLRDRQPMARLPNRQHHLTADAVIHKRYTDQLICVALGRRACAPTGEQIRRNCASGCQVGFSYLYHPAPDRALRSSGPAGLFHPVDDLRHARCPDAFRGGELPDRLGPAAQT